MSRPAAPRYGGPAGGRAAGDRGRAGQRPVRGRAEHRGEGAGGPRLVRRGQPAAGADRHDGRPRRPRPRRGHPHRRGHGRPQPGVHRRPRRRDQGPRHPRLQAAAAVPGGRPTRCWCAGSSRCAAATRCRATGGWSTASPPSASCCARCARRADLVVDTSTVVGAAAARHPGAGVRHARPSRSPASPCCRSATSTGCRWTPTWSSTSGSCPTRSGSRSCASYTGRDDAVRDYVLSQEGAEEFIGRYLELLAADRRRLPPRGQALPDGLGRAAPAASTAASRSARRSRAGSPARSGVDGQGRAPRPGARVSDPAPAGEGPARGAPRAVALGGGHGLHATLSALCRLADRGRVAEESPPSSRWPTTAARRGGCAASSGCCRPATCGWRWPRWPTDDDAGRRAGGRWCSTASAAPARWPGTPWATCCWPG